MKKDFEILIEYIFSSLLKLSMRSAKVFHSRAIQCSVTIVTVCHTSKVYEKLFESASSSCKTLRLCVAECVFASVTHHETFLVEEFVQSFKAYLERALADAAPEVREVSRKTFVLFQKKFPRESEEYVYAL